MPKLNINVDTVFLLLVCMRSVGKFGAPLQISTGITSWQRYCTAFQYWASSKLRRWTEGATYIRQGGHHIGHWPTILVLDLATFQSNDSWDWWLVTCNLVVTHLCDTCSHFSPGVRNVRCTPNNMGCYILTTYYSQLNVAMQSLELHCTSPKSASLNPNPPEILKLTKGEFPHIGNPPKPKNWA